MALRSVITGVSLLAVVLGLDLSIARAQAPPAPARDEAQAIRDDVERLRREFEALRAQYDQRLAALETRLAAVEGPKSASTTPSPPAATPPSPVPPTPAAAAPPTTVDVPAGAAGAEGPTGALPVYGNTAAMSKIFNPDIAVIGDVLGAVGRNDVSPSPALEMHEAEASFQAIVDPYARADFFVAFGPEGVEVEEGFITFNTLPGGLLLKAGKLRGAFGKVNAMHNHVLPWTDRPLVTQNLVGGEEGISDSGVSVSRLLLNPWFFLEATGEVYRGESSVFASHKRSDLTYIGRLRGYRDVSEASNLDVGASIAYGHNDAGLDRTTRLIGVDATFRYRPLRRAIYQRFLARTELVWSRREAELDPTTSAFGWYASGDYQFARRWFVGGRFDYAQRADDGTRHDRGGSALLTFWPSEFSQIRGQYRRTRYAEGATANELLFQFLFSIGAHGAHTF
jgi:hypothetical protein